MIAISEHERKQIMAHTKSDTFDCNYSSRRVRRRRSETLAEHPVVRAAAKMNILPGLPERLLDLSKEQRGCSTGMTVNRLRASKNLFV